MKRTKKETAYLAAICIVAAAAIIIVICGVLRRSPQKTVPQRTEVPIPSVQVEYVDRETIIEVQKEITADIIQDGLRDMGTLITGEYWFTEVADYSSVKTFKTFWNDKTVIPGTESSYTVSYDGTVTAGIDFEKILVRKDDDAYTIIITIPKATILGVDIDPKSFALHHEKQSILNPTSVTDYNDSLVELENNARTKALNRGLLKRADENAYKVIENFVTSLVDTNAYSVIIKTM